MRNSSAVGSKRPAASTSEVGRSLSLILAAILLAACQRHGDAVQERLHAFGSETDIEIRGSPRDEAMLAIADASQLLSQREREWHAWEASDLTRINAALRSGRTVPAPPSIIALLERAKPLARSSDGLFDPSIGGLVELWGFHTSEFPVRSLPPTLVQIEAWRARTPNLSQLRIDGNRLRTNNRALQLDFNAIAEGMASAEIAQRFRQRGIRHALINMGGDVCAVGDGDGEPWRVGMKDPYGGALGWVELGDGEAFYNSGNYNKFRQGVDGARWGHILDPRTGMPARGAAATAVLHRDPVLADAASTALMVGGPAIFEKIARQMKLGCALMVTDENELLITTALRKRMQFVREPIALGAPLDLGADCSPR